jgi:uncharacterized RmlC-like cupin family protein
MGLGRLRRLPWWRLDRLAPPGDYATYGYVTSGGMMVEFGPGGGELVEIGEGDFIFIPGHLVHRESVAPDGGAGVIVRVGGAGATVFNVEGPDPAT